MRRATALLLAIGSIVMTILLQDNLAQAWMTITGWDAEKPTGASALLAMLVVGALAGLVLASIARTAFVKRWQLRFQLKTVADVEEHFGVPVVGKTPDYKYMPQPFDFSGSALEEECFKISLRLRRDLAVLRPSILVTGAAAADGKSLFVRCLAQVLARNGDTVLIVDADLRRPSQHRYFQLPQQPGLTEFLSGHPLEIHSQNGVDLLCAGAFPPVTPEWLSRLDLEAIGQAAGRKYDWVLVDAPPVLGLSDAPILSRVVDCVLMTARLTEISAGVVKDALRGIQTVSEAKILLLLARVPLGQFASVPFFGWGYGYSYGYADLPARAETIRSFGFAELRTKADIRRRWLRSALVLTCLLVMSWLTWKLLATPGPARVVNSRPFQGAVRAGTTFDAVVEVPSALPVAARERLAFDAAEALLRRINGSPRVLTGARTMNIRVQLDRWPSGRMHVSRLGRPMFPYVETLRYDLRDIEAARFDNLAPADIRKLAVRVHEPLSAATVERPLARCRLLTFQDC